ncbi:EAL domain-containing protein [Novosphingobium sp. Chol11]|uniref:putative bifunctional diguanylate cyclase/phosphodiesterase n=1 Tax=Novosphingobium sp. Chol11 TaxID=1385763 RepID=UPI0025D146C6|nr:EAL domain-containing protein [Novosphingobium sp. Chol11]
MAVKNLLKGWSAARAPDGPKAAPAADDAARRLALFEDIERASTGWFWATDREGHLSYISPGAAQRFGIDVAALLGKPVAALFETDPDDQAERSGRPLQFILGAHARLADVTVRLIPALAGEGAPPAWWALSGQARLDAAGAFSGYRGSARDITTEYERQTQDSRAAEYDSLTGLANRHRIVRRLDQVLAAYRQTGQPCALVLLDLDRFKAVNDTLGHQAGDELLRQVGARLTKVVGKRGEIGRLGGDEFQIVLPGIDDRGKLGELADRIIGALSLPYELAGDRAVIGASLGMAIAPFDGGDRDDLTRAADLALYAAKHGGRGVFRFYSADLRDEKDERRQLEDDVRAAVASLFEGGDCPQLDLRYQPVVRLSDHRVMGFEALLRWERPDCGEISPEMFVPVAEDIGLIGLLGGWVLRRACADAAAWPLDVRVAVNVSAVQFADPAFPAEVADVLESTGLAPERLELELTEAVFMGDSHSTDAAFKALKALGVRLTLDDFGTGFSSLSYLRSAPFDKLKVDRSFVETCTLQDQNSARIIAAIIGLADALGMETTVEGVEAFDQRDVVCARGAKQIQGFLYSAPLGQQAILDRIGAQTEPGAPLLIEPSGPDRHRPERRSVYRRVGLIHQDHRYNVLMRNLSATGALLEGIIGVPEGTGVVLDLGGGQLAVCTVSRSQDAEIAVEFETALVSDGARGLVTRHRASPAALAAAARIPRVSTPQFLEVETRKPR